MHILKSLLLLSFLFSQNSHGLTAQEVLLLSPKDIFTKPALLKGGFLDEKKFAFFSSEPPNMDSDPNRPVLTLTINNPTTDKLIDTLVIIDNNYEQPIGKNPVNKNKFEAFLTKHSIKLENLNSKLNDFPATILGSMYSIDLITIDKNAKKEGDNIEYLLKLKKEDGTAKEVGRFKHPIPCSNNLVAQQVLSEKPVRKFTRTELLGTCMPPKVLGYYLDAKESQMVLLVEEYRQGGYFEGDIEWQIKRHLIGGKTKSGFKK